MYYLHIPPSSDVVWVWSFLNLRGICAGGTDREMYWLMDGRGESFRRPIRLNRLDSDIRIMVKRVCTLSAVLVALRLRRTQLRLYGYYRHHHWRHRVESRATFPSHCHVITVVGGTWLLWVDHW